MNRVLLTFALCLCFFSVVWFFCSVLCRFCSPLWLLNLSIDSRTRTHSHERSNSTNSHDHSLHATCHPPELRTTPNSLKLIRGSIDQVDGKASISWVQPRVLSREQIGMLAKRLQVWNEKLHGVEERIAPELLASA